MVMLCSISVFTTGTGRSSRGDRWRERRRGLMDRGQKEDGRREILSYRRRLSVKWPTFSPPNKLAHRFSPVFIFDFPTHTHGGSIIAPISTPLPPCHQGRRNGDERGGRLKRLLRPLAAETIIRTQRRRAIAITWTLEQIGSRTNMIWPSNW